MTVDPSTLAMTDPCPVCDGRARLSAEISRLNGVKVAQDPESAEYAHFQNQINEVTAELLRLEEVKPRIRAVDDEIKRARDAAAEATNAASDAFNDSRTVAWRYWRPAGWLGAIGAILLLVGATPIGLVWWLWILAGLMVSTAAGLGWMGIQERSAALADQDDADDDERAAKAELERLQLQRQALLPVVYSETLRPGSTAPRMVSALPAEPASTPPAGIPAALVPQGRQMDLRDVED